LVSLLYLKIDIDSHASRREDEMVRKTKKGEVKFRPGSEILSKKVIRKGKKKEGTIYEIIEAPRKNKKSRIVLRGADGKLREVEMTRAQLKAYEKELERSAGMAVEAPGETKEKPVVEETVPPIVVAEQPGEQKLRTPTLYAVMDKLEKKLGPEAFAKIPKKRLIAYAHAVKEFKEEGEKAKEEKEKKEKKIKAKKGWSMMSGKPSGVEEGTVVKMMIAVIALILVLSLLAWISGLF